MWWLGGCLLLAPPPELTGGGWFGDSASELTPEERGAPVDVGVGYGDACVVYESGAVLCSGYGDEFVGSFVAVDGGLWGYCAIADDGAMRCSTDDEGPPRAEQVDVGQLTACALVSGRIECWGSNSQDVADPVSGSDWVELGIGTYNGCAVAADGDARCWGSDSFDVTRVPSGNYVDVATADFNACGVRDDGDLRCWGNVDVQPPSGRFVAIEAGDYHYCALAEDGGVACWGDDDHQQASPPRDAFLSIDAAHSGNCGITTDHEVVCWGDVDEADW